MELFILLVLLVALGIGAFYGGADSQPRFVDDPGRRAWWSTHQPADDR
jgi:hypothetical protein